MTSQTSSLAIARLQSAKRESKRLDFKERFDTNSVGDWCEIIKDIVAMANSGGGCILVGPRNDGSPSGWDVAPVLALDPALVTDKIAKYTGVQFSDFEFEAVERDGERTAAIFVRAASVPMIFVTEGVYKDGTGKEKMAFRRGTVYFRHGAKSEVGCPADLKECIEREVERLRRFWLSNIRKIVHAPTGHQVSILPPEVRQSSSPSAQPIRITSDDPNAPVYQMMTPDDIYFLRRTDVVSQGNMRIGEARRVNGFDIDCIRKVYLVDDTKADFIYKSKFGSPRYSDAFVDWLVKEYERDSAFFDETRERCKPT
jgi:hypothetical protein